MRFKPWPAVGKGQTIWGTQLVLVIIVAVPCLKMLPILENVIVKAGWRQSESTNMVTDELITQQLVTHLRKNLLL